MRLRPALFLLFALFVLFWTACTAGEEPAGESAEAPEPIATLFIPEENRATATVTPSPAATPTPRPDQIAPTLTPTATPQPGVGSEADVKRITPSAPPVPRADLLFISDSALQLWSAEDGQVRTLIPAAEAERGLGAYHYVASESGDQILAVIRTEDGPQERFDLVHIDLNSGEQRVLQRGAARFAALALSPDGSRYTFAPDENIEAPGPLTIYLGETGAASQPEAWGTCRNELAASAPEEVRRLFGGLRCSGAIFTQDGQNVIWADGVGLWIQSVDGTVAYMVAEHDYRDPAIESGFYDPLAWSPSGRYLMLTTRHWEWTTRAVLDVPTDRIFHVPHYSQGYGPRTAHLTWMNDDRLLMVREPARFEADVLEIYRVPDEGTALVIDEQREFPTLSATLFAPFHHAGGEFSLAAVNAAPTAAEVTSGIYQLSGPNEALRLRVPFPPTDPLYVVGAIPQWTQDGTAVFLAYATSDLNRPAQRFFYVDLSTETTYDITPLLGQAVYAYSWLEGS